MNSVGTRRMDKRMKLDTKDKRFTDKIYLLCLNQKIKDLQYN